MNITLAPAIFPRMTDLRSQQLAWLENICSSAGVTLTEVARRAKLNPSTLSRFKAGDNDGHTLTSLTVKKIEEATGVPAYEQRMRPRLVAFSDGEAEPFSFKQSDEGIIVEALQALVSKSNTIDLWTLKTNMLEAVGYREGDVIVVDRDFTPRVGDAVCAQRYDWRRSTAETIFRVYRPPYLMSAASAGEPEMPELVDGENIMIKGVVLGGVHLRR